jgi:hypothetical protein
LSVDVFNGTSHFINLANSLSLNRHVKEKVNGQSWKIKSVPLRSSFLTQSTGSAKITCLLQMIFFFFCKGKVWFCGKELYTFFFSSSFVIYKSWSIRKGNHYVLWHWFMWYMYGSWMIYIIFILWNSWWFSKSNLKCQNPWEVEDFYLECRYVELIWASK